ncbi:MAG TPA: hypothetical protein VLV17_09675 [Anaeromyxobacteraceae bacterium]|nr:hypothetical protein [Anaeromyxobacteraceae bacterium]
MRKDPKSISRSTRFSDADLAAVVGGIIIIGGLGASRFSLAADELNPQPLPPRLPTGFSSIY